MSINYKTQLILTGSNTVLTFDTAAQKRAYVKLLKKKGAVCAPVPVEAEALAEEGVDLTPEVSIPAEQLEALHKLGWLRDEAAKAVKPKTKDIGLGKLNPLGRMKSQVVYDGETYPMPNIYSAILGNMIAQEVLEGDVKGFLQLVAQQGTDTLLAYKEALLTKAQEAEKEFDLLGAIEAAYMGAIDVCPEMEEILLETGDTILVYKSKTDILFGQIQEQQELVGQNLIGLALMQLRWELGGALDPRIQLIRGKKVYTHKDVEPTFEGTDEGYPMQLAEIQAKLLLKEPSEGASEKKKVAYQEQLALLADFMVTRNWWPFPELRETVFIFGKGMNTMPKALKLWIAFLAQQGEVFSAAKVHESLGVGYLQPVDKVFKVNGGIDFECIPYDPAQASSWIQLPLSEAGEWWAWYLSGQTEKLSPEDLVELFTIMSYGLSGAITVNTSGSKVSLTQGEEIYEWDFRYNSVKARQNRKAFKVCLTKNSGVNSKFTLLWLLLKAHKNLKGINDILNRLANLWEREANYGHSWEDGHPTRMVRDNSGAPLNWTSGMSMPFGMTPLNGQFNNELFLSLIHTPEYRHGAYTDKNGTNLIANHDAAAAALTAIQYEEQALLAFECLDLGVNPLLVLPLLLDPIALNTAIGRVLKGAHPALIVMEEFGWFLTANDGAKVEKFLNRAQQGASWNEVLCWLKTKKGEIHRSRSLFKIKEKLSEPIIRATLADEEALLGSIFG